MLLPFLAQVSSETIIRAIGIELDTRLYETARNLGVDTIGPIALAVAQGTLPITVLASVTFMGFRVIQGEAIVQGLMKLLITAIIAYFMLVSQLPQKVMDGSLKGLGDAGGKVSEYLINNYTGISVAGTGRAAAIVGWQKWIGDALLPGNQPNPKYKYNYQFIREVIFDPDPAQITTEERNYYNNLVNNPSNASDLMKKTFGSNNVPPGQNYTPAIAQALFNTTTTLQLAMMAATQMMAGQLYPTFSYAAVMGGAYYAFFIGLGLSFFVPTLIWFKKTEEIWGNSLRGMVSVLMVVFFYPVFAGVGFVFSFNMFEVMFKPLGVFGGTGVSGLGMGRVLNSLFMDNFVTAYNAIVPVGTPVVSGPGFEETVRGMLKMFLVVGRQVGGVTIITAFIAAGSSLAMVAVKMGSLWDKGFAANETGLMEGINQSLNQIQGAIMAGLSSMYQSGAQSAGAVGGGLMSGIGRRLTGG